jgi:hypothetical protein
VQKLYVEQRVKDGVYQAMMEVALVNDGPVGLEKDWLCESARSCANRQPVGYFRLEHESTKASYSRPRGQLMAGSTFVGSNTDKIDRNVVRVD